jgi:Zn-dependent peptidase ImmA (M78 family)
LLLDNKKGRREFSLAHECGHAVLHNPDLINYEDSRDGVITCRVIAAAEPTSKMPRGYKTPEEWREWQADYFAACLKLPIRMVSMYARRFLKEVGHLSGCVSVRDIETLDLANMLASEVADFFITSAQAARIRLRELRVIREDNETVRHLRVVRDFKDNVAE